MWFWSDEDPNFDTHFSTLSSSATGRLPFLHAVNYSSTTAKYRLMVKIFKRDKWLAQVRCMKRQIFESAWTYVRAALGAKPTIDPVGNDNDDDD